MNEYNIKVNFEKGTIESDIIELVVNDYNSTKLNFEFDKEEGRNVFKLLYPDGTFYVDDIANNELILEKGILNQNGKHLFEITKYGNDDRLTVFCTKEMYVRLELANTDEITKPDDRVPILDNLINEVEAVKEYVNSGGFDGATFIPTVDASGNISWTNDKNLENPITRNIMGPQGAPGAIKIIPVQVLPTENIDESAIYVVPVFNGIKWDGDTTDRETYYNQTYKVSDLIPTKEELVGQTMTMTQADGTSTPVEITDDMIFNWSADGDIYYVGSENTPMIQIFNQTGEDTEFSNGVYFMKNDYAYVSSLTLPAEAETKNKYEEFIYVNGSWEPFGSSSVAVDMSNYYTKEETDNVIVEITESLNNPYALKFVAVEDIFDDTSTNYTTESVKSTFEKMVNETYNSENKYGRYVVLDTVNTNSYAYINNFAITTQKTTYDINGILIYGRNSTLTSIKFANYKFSVRGKWTDDVFTCSSMWGVKADGLSKYYSLNDYATKSDVLTKANKTQWTPTGDYNPATKKYVDDSIASAITTTLGGSY